MRGYSECEKQLIEKVFLENKVSGLDTNRAFEFAKDLIENCINNEKMKNLEYNLSALQAAGEKASGAMDDFMNLLRWEWKQHL